MRQERLELLRDALTALASDAPDQVRYLNSLEMPVSVDELALDLEAIAAAAPEMLDNGEIDAEQFECVRSLNERLSEMSGPHNAGLWTEAALLSSPQWDAIRDRAKACLGLHVPEPIRELTCLKRRVCPQCFASAFSTVAIRRMEPTPS